MIRWEIAKLLNPDEREQFHQKLVFDKSLSADEFYRIAIKQMKPLTFKSLKSKRKKGTASSTLSIKQNTLRRPTMNTIWS